METNEEGEISITGYSALKAPTFTKEQLCEAYIVASHEYVKAQDTKAAALFQECRKKSRKKFKQSFETPAPSVNRSEKVESKSMAASVEEVTTEDEEEVVNVYGKYKPVDVKVKPVKTTLPSEC